MTDIVPVVIAEIHTTNFDLLRLLNGGTADSKGSLFSIRTIKTYETKTKTGRPMHGLVIQVITQGINNPVARKDVVIKKVVEKQIVKVIKEVPAKPKEEQIKFEVSEEKEVLF